MLSVRGLAKRFPLAGTRRWWRGDEGLAVHAVNGVDLEARRGEALCVVGESGCGKSTLARLVARLIDPSAGEIHLDDQRIDTLHGRELWPLRQRVQMIFQNPYASLNPRMTVQQTLLEPVRLHRSSLSQSEAQEHIEQVMRSVGVDPSWGARYPHEFSGGQRQRISIARALSVSPELVIADEPISALDVSIQAQVLNVLMEAQASASLTYLFITHDLSVVEHFGDRVAVMYLGRICELAPARSLFSGARHPYTQALLSAIPRIRGQHQPQKLHGEVPTPVHSPSGCVFHGRCPLANARCREQIPVLRETQPGHTIACHAVEEGRD